MKNTKENQLRNIISNIIKEEISKIDEGFLDRAKAKIKGATSYVGTGVSNVGKAFTGKKDQIKDPVLAKGMTMLQQKTKTFEKEINDVLNDINKLFPETSLESGPEELTKLIKTYKSLLNQAKKYNTQISSGVLPK